MVEDLLKRLKWAFLRYSNNYKNSAPMHLFPFNLFVKIISFSILPIQISKSILISIFSVYSIFSHQTFNPARRDNKLNIISREQIVMVSFYSVLRNIVDMDLILWRMHILDWCSIWYFQKFAEIHHHIL